MAMNDAAIRLQGWYKLVRRDDATSCWWWTGHKTAAGYGVARHTDGHRTTAHRVGYELLHGPIPDGMELDHLCRNRACVNPEHLEPVTHAENVRRSDVATGSRLPNGRKTHCPKGHPYSPENTREYPSHRVCIACSRERSAAFARANPNRAAEYQRSYRARKAAAA